MSKNRPSSKKKQSKTESITEKNEILSQLAPTSQDKKRFFSKKLSKMCVRSAPGILRQQGTGVECGAHGGETPISFPPLVVTDDSYKVLNFSFDTLVLNFSCVFTEKFNFFPLLKEEKTALQSGMDKEKVFYFCQSDLFSWNLQRTGRKFFPYIFRSGDLSFCLSERPETSTIPNVCLNVGSVSCNSDLASLISKFRLFLTYLGVKIVQETVSRADICADILGKITETDIENQEKLITRADKFDEFYGCLEKDHNDVTTYHSCRVLSGVQVGRGEVVGRVYDKMREMTEKRSLPKQEFFLKKWGTTIDQDVMRVEFQLRREAIKQFCPKHSTFADVCRKIKEIWQYLVTRWLRHSAKPVDRKNKNQAHTQNSDFWDCVVSASNYKSGKTPPGSAKREKKHCHTNIKDLTRQATGIYLSIIAAVGHKKDDFFGILGTCKDLIDTEMQRLMRQDDFGKRFDIKRINAFSAC